MTRTNSSALLVPTSPFAIPQFEQSFYVQLKRGQWISGIAEDTQNSRTTHMEMICGLE